MTDGVQLLHALLASAAVVWLLATIAAVPFLHSLGDSRGSRSWARIAVLGAVCIAAVFFCLAIALAASMSFTPWPISEGTWAMALEDAARTTSTGAAVLVIAVAAVAIGVGIFPRTRAGGWSVLLLLVVLLAGGVCSELPITRRSAFFRSLQDIYVFPPPLLWAPESYPARWLDQWSRSLANAAPVGLLFAFLGMVAAWRSLRRATARGLPALRESACASLALLGLAALSLSVLELEKSVQWTARDQWRVWLVGGGVRLEVAETAMAGVPMLPRPLIPAGAAVVVALGSVVTALFGEFHLRGRRVLREPEPAAAATGAP